MAMSFACEPLLTGLGAGGYMLVAGAFVTSTLYTTPRESLEGLALALLGVPLYLYWHWRKKALHRRARQVAPRA